MSSDHSVYYEKIFEAVLEKHIEKQAKTNDKHDAKEDKIRYRNSGFCQSFSLTAKGETVLSELLYSLINEKSAINKITKPPDGKLEVGSTGIYRRAVPKTKTSDFGFVEELRVIVGFRLYGRRLCLLLSPVISIDPFNVITYYKDCIVKLVLHDEGDEERPQRWVKVLKGGYFIRGSSFDASPHIVGRTIVVDGIYHEEASKKVRKSARGVVPMRFVPLFEEAVDPTPIIW